MLNMEAKINYYRKKLHCGAPASICRQKWEIQYEVLSYMYNPNNWLKTTQHLISYTNTQNWYPKFSTVCIKFNQLVDIIILLQFIHDRLLGKYLIRERAGTANEFNLFAEIIPDNRGIGEQICIAINAYTSQSW